MLWKNLQYKIWSKSVQLLSGYEMTQYKNVFYSIILKNIKIIE
jgi:hypothetical protein